MADEYVNWGNPLTARDKSEEDPTWGDYGKALGSGVVSIGTGAAALAEYAGEAIGSESLANFGRTGRDLGNTANDQIIESMTEPAQRALGASFLPGDDDISAYDDLGSSLGLKVTAALPSLIASVVPGGVAARAFGTLAGTIAGSAAGATLNAGDVANTIYSEFDKQSDDELRASNPMYDAYRLGGMDEKEARAAVRQDVIGYAPALAFVFTAATSKFGPEGAVARIFGGDAKAGAVRGLMRGYLGEAGQEGSEGFFNEYLQGNAAATGGYGEFDQGKAWEQALEGALIGGILGAPFGAVEGMSARAPRVDPNPDTSRTKIETAPPAGPDITQAAAIAAQPVAPKPAPAAAPAVGPKGRKVKSSKKVTEAAPPVQEVPVGGLSADEQAAAVATQDNQIVPPSPQMQAQQLAEELAAIQTPQAQAPVQAPVETPAAPVAPNVLEAQQLAQELPQVPTAQAPAPAVDPVPEQTQTIDAQREQLVGGERKAVLYTPNQPVPPELPGMKRIKVKDQIWDYNPKQITAKDIRAAVKAKRENEILDLGSVAKQDMPVDAPEVAVVARDNMGVETRAAVGTPDTAPQQLAEMQATQKSNEAQIAIEPADQVIVERLQNPPKAAKAKAASKARTPVKAPEIVVVPTGEAKIGPEGKKIIEVESAVAKQQREAALAEIEQDANKNDVDMSRGNRDAGTNAQAMSDRKSRERFITRVETELKKGDKAAPWAKQADAVRKKFGDKLGRGKKAPAGYYDALQAAHEAEVSTRAVEPAPEKPLTKKEAAKQATAEKRAAEAAKTAEEKAAELETQINESTTLSMKNKATLRAVLANDKQTMAERVETAELAMRQFAEASGDAGGTDVTARGSGSKGGDRGLSIDAAREEGFDIVEAIDNIDEAPDALLAGDIGELTATDEDVLAAAKSLEETYEATQEPITRERPTVELAEGEGFTAVTETKPVNKVDNPLAQLKPKVSGKISLNKTVKVVGEKSNLRGNTRQSFSIESSGQIITPLQSTTVGAMLDRLDFDHLNGLARVLAPKLRKALRQSAANVQLHIIDETQMRAVDPTNPRGFYLHSGHVFIRADQLAENGAAYAIMHEAVHAAFLNAMRSKPAIAKMVERMRKATLDHHFGGDQVLGEEFYYGFENADEFLAEAMSNPDFQDLLAQTPMPEDMARELGFDTGSRFSLWNALVEEIRKWLGLGNSDRVMLEGIMRIGQKLESVAARANAQSTSTGISALRAEDITSEVKTRAKVAGEGMTGVAIKAMTLDFMRQKFGGLFNGAFDRYVEAVQQRDNIVNTVADLHDKDAAEFIELMRRTPDEGVAMADLAMDATRLDVNLGPNADNSHLGKNSKKGIQARKRIDELQARYDALQPETQKLMQRMTANYRDTHNANVTALAYNVLSELPVKLSNSDLMQLLDKVTSGTLTDEDAKTVGDPTIFNSLRRSTELKTIKGMYFPNMRFGDHVVLTREKVTAPDIKKVELRGGKLANVRTELVGDNTVRFIGDPSVRGVPTALMRLADDFVAKSDLPLVAYRKRSMDRTTGEVVSASEERSDREYDVVYEVELRNQGVHFFDSATDAEKFRASSTSDKTSQVLDRRADQVQQMISSSALSNVVKAIEARKDLPETRRKQMRNVLEAAIVANLPGNRAEARYQARRNVKGASKDVGRAALAYGRAAGNFQATLQTAPAQRDALREMTEIEGATKFGENAATISKVMNEVRAREAVIEGPLSQNKFFQDVATLSFFDKLVSPAYNIVNFQQVIMNSLPVLGGRYGLWRTNSAIMAAYKRVGTLETILSGVKNTASAAVQWNRTSIDTTDLLGSIRKNLGPKYEPLVDMFIKRGAISPDIGLEIAAALSEGRGAWGQGLSKFDRIARQLPGAVEAVNRMVSAVATYDLAIASGKGHQAAMQEAFDVTLNTQGDYRRSNSPRFMNDGKLAWALQFKKFAVLQTQLMGDMFYRAMKDVSPEERAIARKQLAIMVGVQVMYAGALGLPGLELAKLVFTMGAALGLSDGWEDQERRIKRILADSIGKTPAELITSGVVSRAIGIDVSKRMSQADLWTGFAPKSYDAAGITQYIGTAILGAPGATAIDWMSASKELVKGDVLKALELAVPVKTFADTATAVRKYQEGKYSPTDAALKVIGFTSARQARIAEETGNRIKDRKKAKEDQNELVKSYLNARSTAERVKAKSKIREFNNNVPEGGRKISINGLDRILEEQRQIYATQ